MSKTDRPDAFAILRARLDGIRELLENMNEPDAEALIRMLMDAERIFVTGKGRSGKVAECFAVRLMQMGFAVHVPGESTCPRIHSGDLMVAISCSGTTRTTVQLARISREAGARVACMTAVPGSELTGIAHHAIVVPTTGDQVKRLYRYVVGPYNNTLFEQSVLLYCDALVYSILEREGIPTDRLRELHTNLE
jgi:6-phospho-3-hexuloisomerase